MRNLSNIYRWSVTNGTIVSGSFGNSIAIQWNGNASTGKVTTTLSDANGCLATSHLDVNIVSLGHVS